MEIKVLDKGFVRLENVSASDEMVARAARVSFAGQDEELTDERIEGLIRFLVRNLHHSPLEHGIFTFHLCLPIFVMREHVRHRLASINEVSGRYSVLDDKYYVPAVEHVRTQTGKPGAYTFEPVDEELAERVRDNIIRASESAFAHYHNLLETGIAKELARVVLPVNTYTSIYWTVNPRGLMHYLSLRNAPEAMLEIREYAKAIESIFCRYMPFTAKAFQDYGRRS